MWGYPRPPRLRTATATSKVVLGDVTNADRTSTYRVLEMSNPPVFYILPSDVIEGFLVPSDHSTYCEWQGAASYYDVRAGGRTVPSGAWCYPRPTPAFASITAHVACDPGRMDACFVDGERVRSLGGLIHEYGLVAA